VNQTSIDRPGATKGSVKSYIAGFILSIVLTAAAFGLVMSGAWSGPALLFPIIGAAVLQMLIQFHFFLHLDTSSAQRWNVLALLFTAMILVLFVGGSLWIMYDLNYRMM
jgi:cytochrome o ubiquinol oxidase operon protein cyoD